MRQERSRTFCSLEAFVRVRASFSLLRSRAPLVLSREKPATVLLMMREEHHPSTVLSRARRRHGEFVFADLPSSFFLPRYLRLPDICTTAEARPHVGREKVDILICRAFCARRMRGECSSRRDSATRYIHRFDENVFIIRISFRFFLPLLSFSLSPLTDRVCTTRECDCIQIYTRTYVAKILINLTQENANSAIKLNPIFLFLSRRSFTKRPFSLGKKKICAVDKLNMLNSRDLQA